MIDEARREDNCDPELNEGIPSPSAEQKLQGNPTLDQAFAKFKKESKLIRSAMQKWVVVAQSTHYVSSVLTALVPCLLVSEWQEEKLDASDCYGIPTMDGFVCDFQNKTVRKRAMSDLFSKTFNVNKPGSNLECYDEMKTFIFNFACERRSLMEFLLKTWGLNITMDMTAKLIYF